MRFKAAAHATDQLPWSQNGFPAPKRMQKDSPVTKFAWQSTQTRSKRVEAFVRHISQLPAFVAWVPKNAATTPSLVEEYLDSKVMAVVAQLDPIHQAGNYERLILLLAELLSDDLAAGVTPRVVLHGVIDLINSCITAITKGEVSIYEEKRKGEQRLGASSVTALLQSMQNSGSTSVSTANLSRQRSNAAPVESLLPPLVEQPSKLQRDAHIDHKAAVTEDERVATEMEIWENYMATTRAAIISQKMYPRAAQPPAAAFETAACPLASKSMTMVTKCTLPNALCALIERCTSTPHVCLTLTDHQYQVSAVRNLLCALVTIMQGIEGDSTEATADGEGTVGSSSSSSGRHKRAVSATTSDVQAVRLTALKGISRLLAIYLDGTDTKEQQSLTVRVEDVDIFSIFEDLTHQWARTLSILASEEYNKGAAGAKGNLKGKGEGDDLDSFAFVQQTLNSEDGSNTAAQLHWILRIANQIIAAQLRQSNKGSTWDNSRVRTLPPMLIPLALRTLSQIPTASSPPYRAASYEQLCVDVLWSASLLAPSEASRQFVYSSICATGLAGDSDSASKSELSISGRAEANPPAMDLFTALIHKFNESHNATKCELRDDLVSLFALLLRHDIQYVKEELVERRAAPNKNQQMSSMSQSTPLATTNSCEAHATPLTLGSVTVEAINAVAALLFETTCGAELTTTLQFNDTGSGEAAPASLLSIDGARQHALRFRSIATSVARRRELLNLKIYGWQLLDVHSAWQLAHLTYREYLHSHDTTATMLSAALTSSLQHTNPTEGGTEEDTRDDTVTEALWGLQLSQLGFLDVLLMYVDTRTDDAAVMAWTQEERIQLELEAWQLLASMILFSQELSNLSGGVQIRRHLWTGEESPAPEQYQKQEDNPSPSMSSVETRESNGIGKYFELRNTDNSDADGGSSNILYGADKHFIAAGGIQVALHYLFTAPAKAEEAKRWALVTLAAIARVSTEVEGLVSSDSLREGDLSLTQTVLAQHAPLLVPLLVQLIKDVDLFVDVTGVPQPVPPIISSVSASLSRPTPQSPEVSRCAREGSNISVFFSPMFGDHWNWLPKSAAYAALASWCLLRSIGNIVLEEARGARNLVLSMTDDDSNEENDQSLETQESRPSRYTGSTNTQKSGECDRVPPSYDTAEDPKPHDEVIPSIVNTSSSDSSLGDLMEDAEDVTALRYPHPTAQSRKSDDGPSGTESLNQTSAQSPSQVKLRCVDPDVLRIPEIFAEHGGVGVLTSWLRHVLCLCFSARLKQRVQHGSHSESTVPRLTEEEMSNFKRYQSTFLLLLNVFRACIMGFEDNEIQFVESGGVHGILDLIEAFALKQGLIDKAARHVRRTAADHLSSAAAGMDSSKDQDGVLTYASTLLSDLLESCPRATDAFFTWRSRHILLSPLTPDVRECTIPSSKGIDAVKLLLCLWVSEMSARDASGPLGAITAAPESSSGLTLLRFHLRGAVRTALREEYVCRLLRRRSKLGVLQTDVMRNYYRYLHTEVLPQTASPTEDDTPDSVVLEYMKNLMSRNGRNSSAAPEQQIPLLIYSALGLSMKVFGCLSTVGFDSLCPSEVKSLAVPSKETHLSSLERSFLIQVAALPALCVDEICAAMAEVALEGQHLFDAEMDPEDGDTSDPTSDAVMAWRPTTPDRRVLRTAAEEASVRGKEIYQLIELGMQVQHARDSQLYSRFLVSQLRQPVGQPPDGHTGAVKGLWKTQRRLSFTRGSALSFDGDTTLSCAAELSARLSNRLAVEQQQQQQLLSSTVWGMQRLDNTQTEDWVGEAQSAARQLTNTQALLGISRTPYPSLMNSIDGAAHVRHSTTSFSVVAPPRRPALPLSQRHKQRQAMIARSLRKLSLDDPAQHASQHP